MKKWVDLKYKVLKSRGLKYISQFKTQIKKLFWLILFYNKWYMLYVIIQLSDDAVSSLTKVLKKILTRFRSNLLYTTHSRMRVIPIDLFPVCFFFNFSMEFFAEPVASIHLFGYVLHWQPFHLHGTVYNITYQCNIITSYTFISLFSRWWHTAYIHT
jgi:hypothetical protein